MDVDSCIEGRTSTRVFKSDPVDEDTVVEALRMANLAPSAGNLQARDMVVVKNDHTKRLLAEAAYGQDFIRVAPVAVVFCANMQRIAHYGERGEELYALQDVAAAVENMMLFLHGRGIGSVWVGAFDERKAAEAIGTPDHARPVAIVPMGYPAEKGAHRKRLALDEVVHWEKW